MPQRTRNPRSEDCGAPGRIHPTANPKVSKPSGPGEAWDCWLFWLDADGSWLTQPNWTLTTAPRLPVITHQFLDLSQHLQEMPVFPPRFRRPTRAPLYLSDPDVGPPKAGSSSWGPPVSPLSRGAGFFLLVLRGFSAEDT